MTLGTEELGSQLSLDTLGSNMTSTALCPLPELVLLFRKM